MAQTLCNGDVTVVTIPQAFSDLTGTVTGTQLPGGAPTGTGAVVMATNASLTSPTLITPVLGTPASGTLTNCTFPVLNQNTTGSSASCTGNAATVTGLVVASGKTHTVNNSITLAGTDATTMTFPGSSDTVVTLGATQTLTSKTLTSPTMTAPALGTPASGTLTNCSGLPAANIVAGTMASGMTLVAPVLGTPASGTLTNCTFPVLNQNTTGTAGGLTGTPAITVGAITSASETCSGVVQAKRMTAHGGTVPTSTSFALSAGWGTTPTLTIVGGTDQACAITIVAKATVGASPTVTYTFKDGTWTNAPIVVCDRTDVSAAAAAPGATVTNQWATTSVSATAVTFTFNGTPVANNTYGLAWVAMGT